MLARAGLQNAPIGRGTAQLQSTSMFAARCAPPATVRVPLLDLALAAAPNVAMEADGGGTGAFNSG